MFQGGAPSVHHLCYVMLWFRARLFIDALWSPAELSFVISNCEVVTFPVGILGQVWCLIVSIPDLCHFSYFDFTLSLEV